MSNVQCFLVEYTETGRLYRRRFVWSTAAKCSLPLGFHNAVQDLGLVVPDPVTATDGYKHLSFVHGSGTPEERADGKWPSSCACGYVFQPGDVWQIGVDSLYRRIDTSRVATLKEHGAGAMYDSWWMDGHGRKGPDGKLWTVLLPDGVPWLIDGPATSGGYWNRSGTAPRLTVTPSILTGGYHGFLTDGVLVSC